MSTREARLEPGSMMEIFWSRWILCRNNTCTWLTRVSSSKARNVEINSAVNGVT